MDRNYVTSTDLHSVGYDAAARILEIEFRAGGIYHYHEVPADVFDGLMSAASKGRFFNTQIKPKYRCTKLP